MIMYYWKKSLSFLSFFLSAYLLISCWHWTEIQTTSNRLIIIAIRTSTRAGKGNQRRTESGGFGSFLLMLQKKIKTFNNSHDPKIRFFNFRYWSQTEYTIPCLLFPYSNYFPHQSCFIIYFYNTEILFNQDRKRTEMSSSVFLRTLQK